MELNPNAKVYYCATLDLSAVSSGKWKFQRMKLADSAIDLATPDKAVLRPTTRITIVAAAANAVGVLSMWTLPLQISELSQSYGWTLDHAGTMMTFQLFVASVVMVIATPAIPRVRADAFARLGAVIAALGFVLAAVTRATPALTMTGILLTGIGQGLTIVGTGALAARSSSPGQTIGFATAFGIAHAAAWLFLFPRLSLAPWGSNALFLYSAAVSLGWLLLMGMIGVEGHAEAADAQAGKPLQFGLLSAAPIVSCFIVCAGGTAVWSFSEQLGQRITSNPQILGALLSIATASSIVAPLITATVVHRMRNLGLVLFGVFMLMGAAYFVACQPVPVYVFGTALALQSMGQMAVGNLAYIVCVRLDPTARLATLAGSACLFGGSAGPLLGALLFKSGATVLGLGAAILCVVAWAWIGWSEREARRGANA